MARRLKEQVILSIGSNLGDKEKNIKKAIDSIREIAFIKRISNVYYSKPFGFQSKNNFENVVIFLDSVLLPSKLLEELKKIEQRMGRVKTKKSYEDRIIDIDIIFFGKRIESTSNLIIPHPLYVERDFVCKPILEIEDVQDPKSFLMISQLLR